MRNWLLKFRLSAALDSRGQPPADLLHKARQCPETAEFAAAALALDERLRNTGTPDSPASAELHRSIMRAVLGAHRPAASHSVNRGLAWPLSAAAVACALLVALVVWHRGSTPPPARPLTAANTPRPPSASDLQAVVAGLTPPSVVSPLAKEFDNLGLDLKRAQDFILASLP